MMSLAELAIAVLVLLLTPGPSNTLVLLAGAERGIAGALRLVPAELGGYVLTILPLTLFGAAVLARHPTLHSGVTLAAAVWVTVLAIRLWRVADGDGRATSVNAQTLFLTTTLNPKALIFGLVLLPSPDRLGTHLALFASLVVVVAMVWAGIGATMHQRGSGQPGALLLLRRLASVWLAAISVAMMLRGVGA